MSSLVLLVMYLTYAQGQGQKSLFDNENVDASIRLSPRTRIKFCLHVCLCFALSQCPITQHSRCALIEYILLWKS